MHLLKLLHGFENKIASSHTGSLIAALKMELATFFFYGATNYNGKTYCHRNDGHFRTLASFSYCNSASSSTNKY